MNYTAEPVLQSCTIKATDEILHYLPVVNVRRCIIYSIGCNKSCCLTIFWGGEYFFHEENNFNMFIGIHFAHHIM